MTNPVIIGNATLYLGDCREILPRLSGINAIITDPPYGIGYQPGANGKLGHLTNRRKILHDDEAFDPSHLLLFSRRDSTRGGAGGKTPVIIWGANHFADKLPPGQWLCWDKACGKGPHSSFQDAEFAWTTRKTPRCIFHHLWLGFLREGEATSNTTRRMHPSQKPVELMLWCLETARIGLNDTVCDPYMGSASTAIACLRTGRKFIGIEKDPHYFDIACARLEAAQRQASIFDPEPTPAHEQEALAL